MNDALGKHSKLGSMDLASVLRAAGTDKIPSDIATPMRNHGAPLQGWSCASRPGHVVHFIDLISCNALGMLILLCTGRNACRCRACRRALAHTVYTLPSFTSELVISTTAGLNHDLASEKGMQHDDDPLGLMLQAEATTTTPSFGELAHAT